MNNQKIRCFNSDNGVVFSEIWIYKLVEFEIPKNNLDIYNTYNPLKNGDIIIVIAFILFKNEQWIHIKTTGKDGWVLLNNDVADCMKLF